MTKHVSLRRKRKCGSATYKFVPKMKRAKIEVETINYVEHDFDSGKIIRKGIYVLIKGNKEGLNYLAKSITAIASSTGGRVDGLHHHLDPVGIDPDGTLDGKSLPVVIERVF